MEKKPHDVILVNPDVTPTYKGTYRCPKCNTYNKIWESREDTVPRDIVYCWHCGQEVKLQQPESSFGLDVYFEKSDYPKITEENICDYCRADEEECGEYRECCYREIDRYRKKHTYGEKPIGDGLTLSDASIGCPMKKVEEDYEFYKDDGVCSVGVYTGCMSSLCKAELQWRTSDAGDEVLRLSEIVKQIPGEFITIIEDKPLHGRILQYGNYGNFWIEAGCYCGYA